MDKRTFIKISGLASAGVLATPLVSTLIGCGTAQPRIHRWGTPPSTTAFTLPELGFAAEALEPAVDRQTMRIHHGKHHAGYVRKLNAALEGHAFRAAPWKTSSPNIQPTDVGLRNNGGGHFNHALFWTVLTPHLKRTHRDFGGPHRVFLREL